MAAERSVTLARTTHETDIRLSLNLDGSGQWQVDTGVPFFDHMLSHVAVHGLLDLELAARGDIEIDGHHTVEDVGMSFASPGPGPGRQGRHRPYGTRASCPWTRPWLWWRWTFPGAACWSTTWPCLPSVGTFR
jgi:hypothetical protein